MAWVVRAGEARAQFLLLGYGLHQRVPGLYGFSVQYEPGLSVDELALSGRFPNAIISYEDEAVLARAVEGVGYHMRLVRSPGMGHHHTFCIFTDAAGVTVPRLPQVVANVLEQTFRRMPNPHRVPRRRP